MAASAPRFWQSRGFRAVALLPLSAVFGVLAAVRRFLFRIRCFSVYRAPVPVIVVGNIAVGGSGKTPVVLWLVEQLRAAGRRPAIVSRGYGARVEGVCMVLPDADPAGFGDEPVLLARRAASPVAIGRDRPAAVRHLLASHPEVDVVVSDDGLQHFALGRDIELIVVDEAVLGNRWLLPASASRQPGVSVQPS